MFEDYKLGENQMRAEKRKKRASTLGSSSGRTNRFNNFRTIEKIKYFTFN